MIAASEDRNYVCYLYYPQNHAVLSIQKILETLFEIVLLIQYCLLCINVVALKH